METRRTWQELTEEQREQVVYTYADIRGNEEGTPCSLRRAKEEAPHLRAYYEDETGFVWPDI